MSALCKTCNDMHWIEARGPNGRTMIACPACLPKREAERNRRAIVRALTAEGLSADEAEAQESRRFQRAVTKLFR